MVHLGRGVFGSDFGTVAFVIDNRNAVGLHGVYRRLFEQHVEVRSVEVIEQLFRDIEYNRFEVSQEDFGAIPGSPIVYGSVKKCARRSKRGSPLVRLRTCGRDLQQQITIDF